MSIPTDLREAAIAAAANSYSPYSKFPVGAAARLRNGEVITAANVENVSYGLSLCAETALVGRMVAEGGEPGDLVTLVVTDPDGTLLSPCGRCRQILIEFGGQQLEVNGVPMHVLLPGAFTPQMLAGNDESVRDHGH